MKTEKRTNKNDYGWRCRTPLLFVLGLLAVASSRPYAELLPVQAWEVICRGKGNKRDYDTNENCYLGPPEQRRELTRGSLLPNSGDVMNGLYSVSKEKI